VTATKRVLTEWQNRIVAEYGSAGLTAQVLHWMVQAAFPDELQRTAIRIVGDELDHAHLSHQCWVDLGGSGDAMSMDARSMQMPSQEGILASLLDSVLRNFCFGETFAVPLFAAMRAQTTHPAAHPVLDRVLRDEAVHRAFGWDALDVLLEMDPDGVRSRANEVVPNFVVNFHRAYGMAQLGHPLTDEERSMGLLDAVDYRRIHEETLDNDIRRRFAKRGISLPQKVEY